MTKKIANCFNAHFSNAHKLTNNLNPLNAKLNPICHLLALFEAHHILHVSRIRVKKQGKNFKRNSKTPTNNNFKEIFHTNFSEEELKEAICNTKVKKNSLDQTTFSLNLFTTQAQKQRRYSYSGAPEIISQTNGKKPSLCPY